MMSRGYKSKDSLGRARRTQQNAGKAKPAKGDGGHGLRCPARFGNYAKQGWKHLHEIAKREGLLHSADQSLLESWATSFERMRQAEDEIEKYGVNVVGETDRGKEVIRRNPAIETERGAKADMRYIWAQFGLGPFNRQNLGNGEDGQEDPFEALMKRTKRKN